MSPLFLVSLPHASSEISDQCKYGTLDSQMHRYWTIILTRGDFVFRTAALITILCGKGYDEARLREQARKWLRGKRHGYGTYSLVLSRLIEAKLDVMLSYMTDILYVTFCADLEARARTIVADMRKGILC